MSDEVKVRIIDPNGTEHTYWSLKGKTLWETIQLTEWNTEGSCGGRGTCGKCKVRVSGEVSALRPEERELLIPNEEKDGYRLACHCVAKGEVMVYLDHEIQVDQSKNNLCHYEQINPDQKDVRCKQIFVQGLQTEMPVPILDRIKTALSGFPVELSVENLNELARVDRPGRPTIELNAMILDGKKVSYITRRKQPLFGLALDIGSTSLFAALVNIENGEINTVSSHTNMQRIYGEDIISRVSYCVEHEDGIQTLHQIVINNINSMIAEMLAEAGLEKDTLVKVTAVGNPVMLHLFMGLNTIGFGLAPYVGIFSDEISYTAQQLGLNVNPMAQVWILPQLGGFVGADMTACLLTLPKDAPSFLLIDVGTNGEIVLCKGGKMWTASAAAGPAFEGGAITCGMRAGTGAIDRVYDKNEEMHFSVIGNGLPRGICGSGLIDLVAFLLNTGCLEENGTFSAKAREIYQVEQGLGGEQLVLRKGNLTASSSPLVLTQEDIRQVQLAKSAIRTAIDILFLKAGLMYKDLAQIYIAGAFGNYLRQESLTRIGLIPEIDPKKIINIGNAAAEGAILALLSDTKVRESRMLKQKIVFVELASHPDFQNIFLANIHFPS